MNALTAIAQFTSHMDPQIWVALISTVSAPLVLNLVGIRGLRREVRHLRGDVGRLSGAVEYQGMRLAKLEGRRSKKKRARA